MNREERFLSDYRKLRLWADERRFVLQNHVSVRMVALSTPSSNWQEIEDEIGGLKITEDILPPQPNAVIVMLGSSFGLGVPLKDFSQNASFYVAAVQMSALSGHYVGIAVYNATRDRLGDPVARFRAE